MGEGRSPSQGAGRQARHPGRQARQPGRQARQPGNQPGKQARTRADALQGDLGQFLTLGKNLSSLKGPVFRE